jgi:Zn-dependent M28 family amino/carboxypeptidase
LSLVAANSKSAIYYPRTEDSPLNSVVMPTARAIAFFPEWKMDSLVKKAGRNRPLNTEYCSELTNTYTFNYVNDHNLVQASNVIGIIPGSDLRDEYIYITAHYDHLGKRGNKIYYGADDDGSGTCAVIEMAEAFALAKKAGQGPRRTVVFMTVSGEEKGLWGSEYYTDHPLFPLDKTSVDLNIDMVGRKDPNRKEGDNNNYVYVIGHDKLSSELPVINEGVNDKYTKLEFDYKYDEPNDPEQIFYRSDHYNFAKKGVPILFFFDGIHEDYHKTTDTVDKINFDLYEKRIRMIFHTAWEIANRKEMVKRDKPLPIMIR